MESFEEIPSGKEILHELEGENLYVFHGSMNGDIKTFELKQGKQVPNVNKPLEMIEDGSPAISASPHADVAIFRAIMRGKNLGMDITTRFGSRNGKLSFIVFQKNAIEAAKDKKGYVYIFNKTDFEPYDRDGNVSEDNMEWRSYKPVKPIRVVEVNFDDLPKNIEIKE